MFAKLLESCWHNRDGTGKMSFTSACKYAGEILGVSEKLRRTPTIDTRSLHSLSKLVEVIRPE